MIHFHLNADDGTDEETDKQHDTYRVYTQLRHFLYISLQKHPETLGTRKGAPHQDKIIAESGEIFL